MARTNRFSRFNQTVTCCVCGKLTTEDAGDGTELCALCLEFAGWENAHSDNGHSKKADPRCPVCAGITEDEFAAGWAVVDGKKAAPKVKAPKAAGSIKAALEAVADAGPEDRIIVVLVKGNPKKGKRAARFNLYRHGMTVREYLAAGGKQRDLVWDLTHLFIDLK